MKIRIISIISIICVNNSFAYYQAQQGRWMSRDPSAEKGGENLYAFNYNNSILYFDPDGRSPHLIGRNPDGSGIYGPDIDWGDNDPLLGGRGAGQGGYIPPTDVITANLNWLTSGGNHNININNMRTYFNFDVTDFRGFNALTEQACQSKSSIAVQNLRKQKQFGVFSPYGAIGRIDFILSGNIEYIESECRWKFTGSYHANPSQFPGDNGRWGDRFEYQPTGPNFWTRVNGDRGAVREFINHTGAGLQSNGAGSDFTYLITDPVFVTRYGSCAK